MTTTPFLKWPGGKRQLLPIIKAQFPAKFEAYLEPFVGGGATYFDIAPNIPLLSDASLRLIQTYRAVRDCVEAVIDAVGRYRNDEATYYAVRGSGALDSKDIVEVAGALIFLNKTAYNGHYRVNLKNGHNVPFGHYKHTNICDAAKLRACSEALQAASIEHASFEATLPLAQPGDFAYCDPPYVKTKPSDFDQYLPGGFSIEQQVRLRDLAVEAKGKGVNVLISNSDCPTTRQLYSGPEFRIISLQARRSIAADGKRRGNVPELLVANY